MEKINWKNKEGNYESVENMDIAHIVNIYNSLKNKSFTSIPKMWCGRSHRSWCKIFENEIDKRGYKFVLVNYYNKFIYTVNYKN
jgi:hypothetical protein